MTTPTEEALKMAIEGFIKIGNDDEVTGDMLKICVENKRRIKEALQSQEQEPVAWIKSIELLYMKAHKAENIMTWKTNLGLKPEPDDSPLYTHPKEWQELSDDEIDKIIEKHKLMWMTVDFARAILAKAKEKNHGNN